MYFVLALEDQLYCIVKKTCLALKIILCGNFRGQVIHQTIETHITPPPPSFTNIKSEKIKTIQISVFIVEEQLCNVLPGRSA